ncbi:MAG: DUF4251 domain-containing protein [Flavobacteriaceae bacterium]|nr:DUF4251 domain-containing protein [Flavobacteriaceae bacterium]
MKTLLSALVIFMMLISCTSTKIVTEAQQKELISWGNEKPFEIISHRALPMPTAAFNAIANSGLLAPGNSAGNIDLIGNPNYFKMKGDTLSVYLPYFGERRFGGNYGSTQGGIRFDGIPDGNDITWNAKKQRVEMRFKIKQERDNEIYDILVFIFPNHTTRIDINSSERTPISYIGNIESLVTQTNSKGDI